MLCMAGRYLAHPMLSNTQPFIDELERALPSRPFAVELWDGTRLAVHERRRAHLQRALPGRARARAAGPGPARPRPRVRVRRTGRGRPRRGARAARQLGAAAARPPRPGAARRSPRSAPTGLVRPPAVPTAELRPRGRRHSPERDARSVRHHYDVSNDFFRLMLGESMTYSCALFSRGATTLEEAQEAKLELVCTKLALSPGQRVLDVGCGWGSFAIHAAANHGVHVVGHHAVGAAGRARAPARRGARPRRPRGHPGDGLPRPRRRAVRRGGEHRDGRARGLEPDRRLRAPAGAAREARRARAEPRHRAAARGRSRGGPVLGALRVPRRRAAPPLAHPARARARRARDASTWRASAPTTPRRSATGRRTSTATSTRPPASPGPERMRVWRLYLRAARRGFESGFTSIYQVRCSRPTG